MSTVGASERALSLHYRDVRARLRGPEVPPRFVRSARQMVRAGTGPIVDPPAFASLKILNRKTPIVGGFQLCAEQPVVFETFLDSVPAPRVIDIRTAVCRHFSIALGVLTSQSRRRYITRPRQIGMYLARQLTSASFPFIATTFGRSDHTTVLAAVRRIEGLLRVDPLVAFHTAMIEAALLEQFPRAKEASA